MNHPDPIHIDSPASATARRDRGQVAVIFAGAMLLFVLLAATVVDLSWYWTNNLRMQRAADAAALAGVVFLPSAVPSAVTTARAEAAKNGYTHGVGGVVVTPVQDPANDRRLLVTISGPVNTFFARAVGISQWPAQRTAKADYVLPVPMGSPQNYYGVGFYQRRQATTNLIPANTDWNPTAQSVAGRPVDQPGSGIHQRQPVHHRGHQQPDPDLGELQPPGRDPHGRHPGHRRPARCGSRTSDSPVAGHRRTVAIQVAVRKTSSGTWSANVASPVLTTADTDPVQGSNSSLAMWTPHTTWTRNDFANGAFQVRLTWNDGTATCAAARAVQLDQLEVRVQYHTTTTTFSDVTSSVNDPATGTALASQGFWGAVFTSGGIRENGDRHAPAFLGNGTGSPANSANPNHDPDGYDYLVELPGGSGQVRVFDPIFCATGPNPTGGSYGAGDHWTGTPSGQVEAPVSVRFQLLQHQRHAGQRERRRRACRHDLVRPGERHAGRLQRELRDADQPGRRERPGLLSECRPQRVGVDERQRSAGRCLPPERQHHVRRRQHERRRREPLLDLVQPRPARRGSIGSGRMAAYTNLDGGLQAFYFSQIESVHAGKQMVIELFDPGEVSGNGFLRFQNPDGNVYNYATFDWVSDDGRSGNNVTQIQTSINGAAQFNNRLLTITVDLPTTYGSTGLNPPGDITTEQGWWRVEYNVTGGNDTTTWAVSIRGNPVHLVLP